jgi:hypothetical protein
VPGEQAVSDERENQEQDDKRRPSGENVGAQQQTDRGHDPKSEQNRPGPLDTPEGRDVPPADTPRDRDDPWLGGG